MKHLKYFEHVSKAPIEKIVDICNKYKSEIINIILKNKLKIGENSYGDVIAYSVSTNIEGGISVKVYYIDSDGKSKTEFILYFPEDNGFPKFMQDGSYDYLDEIDFGFSMYDDAVELILNELETYGEDWLIYQRDLQKKSRDFQRMAIQGRINDDNRGEYTKTFYELNRILKENRNWKIIPDEIFRKAEYELRQEGHIEDIDDLFSFYDYWLSVADIDYDPVALKDRLEYYYSSPPSSDEEWFPMWTSDEYTVEYIMSELSRLYADLTFYSKDINCNKCGRLFTQKTRHQNFCSIRCREEYDEATKYLN